MSKPMDMKRTSEWVNEECPGEDCLGCGSSECYAMGGKVSLKQQLEDADDNTNSTPIYSTQSSASGQPQAGYGHGWNKNSDNSYSMDDYADPKTWRKNRVASAFAEGGRVGSGKQRHDFEKGSKDIKPNLYAEGGEVEMGDDEMDTALSDAACGELLESIDKKDKAGILEAIRALVLSVR